MRNKMAFYWYPSNYSKCMWTHSLHANEFFACWVIFHALTFFKINVAKKIFQDHSLFCLFVWFDSLRPINNLSVKQGRVFLCWTNTMLGLIFLLKDTMQWQRWGSNQRPLSLESSTLPLSHCALLTIYVIETAKKKLFMRNKIAFYLYPSKNSKYMHRFR